MKKDHPADRAARLSELVQKQRETRDERNACAVVLADAIADFAPQGYIDSLMMQYAEARAHHIGAHNEMKRARDDYDASLAAHQREQRQAAPRNGGRLF